MRKTLTIAGIAYAIVNLTLMLLTPAINHAYDAALGRLDFPGRPTHGMGMQELMVYYDPWLSHYLFPPVFTVGFVAIAFLVRSPSEESSSFRLGEFIAFVLLTLLEIVWLSLIVIQIFCRGPNWNFYWPGEPWDAMRIVPSSHVDLSDYLWYYWLNTNRPDWWLVRESPGIVFLLVYFLSGIGLTLLLRWKQGGFIRYATAVLLFQIAFLVPLKMFCRNYFNIKYFIAFPDLFFNI